MIDILADLTSISCAACRLQFAVEAQWVRDRRSDRSTFYCPNGHTNWFPGEKETDKLKRELAAEQERAEALRREVLSKASMLSTERTKNKRLRTRIKNGVCPCCTRSFTNLKRHMAAKHPAYAVKARPKA